VSPARLRSEIYNAKYNTRYWARIRFNFGEEANSLTTIFFSLLNNKLGKKNKHFLLVYSLYSLETKRKGRIYVFKRAFFFFFRIFTPEQRPRPNAKYLYSPTYFKFSSLLYIHLSKLIYRAHARTYTIAKKKEANSNFEFFCQREREVLENIRNFFLEIII
jgi:hypothetical protein